MSLSGKLGLKDIHIAGKRILIRVDYNVPVEKDAKSGEMRVANNQRISASLPTLHHCLEQGAKAIILMSHLGRPDGVAKKEASLKPVALELTNLLASVPKASVSFVEECVGDAVEQKINEQIEKTQGSNQVPIIILENLRFHLEEEGSVKDEATGTKKKADEKAVNLFRKNLSRLGDVYVNDAFGTAHRAHSSIVGIDLPERVAGFLLKRELDYFGRALENPQRPFLAIVGGAKVSDKILLLQNLLNVVDRLYVGGGMAFTFLKTLNIMPAIGKSLWDEAGSRLVPEIMAMAKARNVSLHFPIDFCAASEFKEKPSETAIYSTAQGIPDSWLGLDIGPQSQKHFAETVLPGTKTIVWNGPAGVFEWELFAGGTRSIANAIVSLSERENDVVSIIGGGDTAAAVDKFGFSSRVSHVSTGGGAALELLEGKKLPGVTFLSDKQKL